jgi:signal transduction histidine kinase
MGLTARTATVVAVVFVPFVAALVYFSLEYFQRHYEQGIGNHQYLLVSRVAADLDKRLRSAQATLERIGTSITPEMIARPDAAQRFLDERITLRLLFDEGLRLVGNDGRVLVESPLIPGGQGKQLSKDDAWQYVNESNQPFIAQPRLSTRGSGAVVLTVAVPLRDVSGRFFGQLHGTVSVEGANIAGDLPHVPIGKDGYFVILTRSRLRVSHPDRERVLKVVAPGANRAVDRAIDERFEGVTETESTTGIPMLAAVKRVPTADWYLFANIPLEEVRGPFRASRPFYAWAVGAGTLLLVVAVWLSLRKVTRPLVETTDAVERIAANPIHGQRIGGVGAGEVARLAGSFDRLLEALEAREEERRKSESERRSLEAQLQQQQRLDSLGVLAGGIAHDFNNLLTPIIANASLAMQDLPAGHALRTDMQEIVTAARRGAELARRILAFSRRQVLETHVVDLNDELRSLEKTLRSVLGEAVELRVEPAGVSALVRADPTQLQQAILNLASNAREAMPDGGKLTVTVSVPGLDGHAPWTARQKPEGRYAVITVSDTGVGIDEENLPRVFEPFFTTKGRTKGTGLGLATVHGVFQQHGGDVEVSSRKGEGTTFRLYLPLAVQPAGSAGVAPSAPPGGRLKVLLVEDEPTIRALAGRILRRAGNDVTSAATPAEALALPVEARPDLLVTDVLLPEMDGIELHRRLCTRWPGLRVLLMSGFPGGHARIEEAIARGDHFLQKPFGPVELLEKVREAASSAVG